MPGTAGRVWWWRVYCKVRVYIFCIIRVTLPSLENLLFYIRIPCLGRYTQLYHRNLGYYMRALVVPFIYVDTHTLHVLGEVGDQMLDYLNGQILNGGLPLQ